MTSGKSWTWFVAVMVVPVVVIVPEPYFINVVVLLDTGNTSFPFSSKQATGATIVGEVVVKMFYRDRVNFTFIYNNISCNGVGAASLAAELHCKHKIGVFIGPGCSEAIEALVPLAKSWNIPIISPVGSGQSEHSLSALVTRLSPFSVKSCAKALVAMLTKYKWYNFAIIFDVNFGKYIMIRDGLVSLVRNSSLFDYKIYGFKGDEATTDMLVSMLVQASDNSRVFILACGSSESRALMMEAYHLGYATSGEYVFFIIDELSKAPDTQYWQMGQPDDEIVLMALGHAIWLHMEVDIRMNQFLKTVLSLPIISKDLNLTQLSPYLVGYSEAVWVYAQVLNETLQSKGDPLNGTDITSSLWNRTFVGFNGPVRINNEGYRQNNVTFSAFHLKTRLPEAKALYDYETDMLDYISGNSFDWPYSHGVPPSNRPICGYRSNHCVSKGLSKLKIGTITGLVGLVVLVFFAAVCLYRRCKSNHNTDLWWWEIPSSDLLMTARNEFSSMYLTHSKHNLSQASTLDERSLAGRVVEGNVALWKGQTVRLRRLPLKQVAITKTVLTEFKQVRDVNHSNLARIFGACFEDSLKTLVTECCSKGSLQDLLGNVDITLDDEFKSSLCKDIIDGLCYIHQSPIHQHGRLNSNVCLIDNRFSVKLTDFGLPTLYSNVLLDVTSDEFKNECKWKAPEILRSGATSTGTMEGDIYSYGMILLEVITLDSPFATESAYMTTAEIIKKVEDGGDTPFRPALELPEAMSDVVKLLQSCWAENPNERPSCQSVKGSIKRLSAAVGVSGNLLENLMRRMEIYTKNLDKMVEEKTAELSEEKKKSEELLYQILPRSVVDRLKSGLRVDPQVYDGVTIYFSDIVGFTQISAVSSPMEVVDLLNDLYLCFDTIIDAFDVYKVETIGDAYMVVSGLPQRNGNLHALNIARMSIKVLEAISEFKIRHMPTEIVQIRIGLHSGPVCAGVVGSKMPRYCLFGDTVNTASRMESSGKAMMIQISPSTKLLLDQFGCFQLIPRGNIAVKGKGDLFTYWLLASQEESRDVLVADQML